FAQAVAPLMKRRGWGAIVNILDVAVLSPWRGYLPFYAAKGGLWTLTLGLAKTLAPQVQVNGIAPGPVLWPPDISAAEKRRVLERTLLKRVGGVEAVAAAVLYLADPANFVTGVVLPVDGGRRLA
ncbi:MAG: hypothetical protein COV76_08650, partial [Candidatus Omnitrophica bacterium CG11_big_fil_rev_8_21_14_0_20_64_10]